MEDSLVSQVTSPDRYQRGIFLFNTWQQYGDGRTRTRNGLLSEKLTIDEMPLEQNLHEVPRVYWFLFEGLDLAVDTMGGVIQVIQRKD